MILKLELDLDNDAFRVAGGAEVARILRETARKIEVDDIADDGGYLKDINGNTVGGWQIEEEASR